MYFLPQGTSGEIQRTRYSWSSVSDVGCFQETCVFTRDASTDGVIVYHMSIERTSGQVSIHEIQRVNEVRYALDVEIFMYASARLVAIATKEDQWIFWWKKPLLELYQKVTEINKGFQWKQVPIGGCHSEPLLVLTSETGRGSTQQSVFRFVFNKDLSSLLPKLERFHKGDGIPICTTWKLSRGSVQYDKLRFRDLNAAKEECVGLATCRAVVRASSGGFYLSFDYHYLQLDRFAPDIVYTKRTQSGFTCHYDIWNPPAKNGMTSFLSGNFEILVVPHERSTIMYRFWYHYNEIPNPKVVSLTNMEQLFLHLKKKLDKQEEQAQMIEYYLKNAVRPRGNQVVQSHVIYNDFSSEGFIGNLIGNEQTLLTVKDASLLAKNIEELETEIDELYSKLEDVVLRNAQTRTFIGGTKVFKGQILGEGVEGKEINLHGSKDLYVPEMLETISRKDREPVVVGDVSFAGKVHVRGNVELGCSINEIATPELLTTDTKQHIDGTLQFLSLFQAKSIISVNRINNVPLRDIVPLE
ncbi:uncharacterized protein LOC111088493 [Limulus polyphemus]|uniref:Uncharacterized protein LOC111088493 n=1 Tax=Limulus polyphemus TaxID=6850 RepID=A0ABM1TF41_LIMPO|nr:uncharacterized protein LOC111088493 [Limulus polyphemus]